MAKETPVKTLECVSAPPGTEIRIVTKEVGDTTFTLFVAEHPAKQDSK